MEVHSEQYNNFIYDGLLLAHRIITSIFWCAINLNISHRVIAMAFYVYTYKIMKKEEIEMEPDPERPRDYEDNKRIQRNSCFLTVFLSIR